MITIPLILLVAALLFTIFALAKGNQTYGFVGLLLVIVDLLIATGGALHL